LDHELAFISSALHNTAARGWLLDGCCGRGQLGSGLQDGQLRRLGLDIDPVALRRFREQDASTPLVQGDMLRQPIADGELDCVIAIHAFDHLDRLGFLAECRRVLRTGGLLIFDFLNRHSYKRAWKRSFARVFRQPDPTYRQKWIDVCSYHDVMQALVEMGFGMHSACGYSWLPFTHSSQSPLVPVIAGLEDLLGLHRLWQVSPRVLVAAHKRSGCFQREEEGRDDYRFTPSPGAYVPTAMPTGNE
jgi:SAM-dependent methyltransferase